jgi:ArsR family transcriptional regulator
MDAVYQALADPTRRRILTLLRKRPHTSGEVAAFFPSAWPTISRHLGVLRQAGLILAERNGQHIHYELNTSVVEDIIQQLLDWTGKGGSDHA